MPITLVILLGALSALAAISTDIYLPAMASMADDLAADNTQIQMTLAIFFIGYGFGQLLFGPLSDSIGRKPVLLAGLCIYILASMACALSTDIDFLIASRLLQALGGCAAAVTARAIVRDTTREVHTAKAMSSIMAIVQIAPLIAPLIGGAILLYFSWSGVFFSLTIYGVVCIVVVSVWIKESHPVAKRQPFHLCNIIQGYREALGNANIVLLLMAEVAAAISLLTFVTGSAFIFSHHYGLSSSYFSSVFALMSTGLLLGSYLNRHYVALKGIEAVVTLCLIIGLLSSVALFALAMLAPEKHFWLMAVLWLSLIPCAAARANYIALGLQYLPSRTGTVAALFGAFSLGIGGIIAVLIGRFNPFTPLNMATMILSGYVLSAFFYSLWRFYNYRLRGNTIMQE